MGTVVLLLAWGMVAGTTAAGVRCPEVFAPQEGIVKPPERAHRAEVCLNGRWQFQPVAVPAGHRRGESAPPMLPAPQAGKWETTPIHVPSPWNVNRWGAGRLGRDVGAGTRHPYRPDSEYYPSYPPAWDDVAMGWLRRTFRVPADWRDRRVVLHFEAVAGAFEVHVNGRKAGEHFDSHLPAEFDITDLVRPETDNELLVGVRHPHLFDRRSSRYERFAAPYPPGSNTDGLVGIWQDVFLLGLPPVRVADVFVQPNVADDRLDVVATVQNDGPRPCQVEVSGVVRPWSGTTPAVAWKLGETILTVPPQRVEVAAGASARVVLSVRPAGRLKTWSPDAPNLYGLVLSLRDNDAVIDTHYERFGWRQLTIHGREVRLNGKPIRMVGDLCHPFGPFMLSRRFAWAWCRMLKDCGGNALRPHAQPFPSYYLDVADEMGVLVLDETAVFGSSVRLNPEAPEFWTRLSGPLRTADPPRPQPSVRVRLELRQRDVRHPAAQQDVARRLRRLLRPARRRRAARPRPRPDAGVDLVRRRRGSRRQAAGLEQASRPRRTDSAGGRQAADGRRVRRHLLRHARASWRSSMATALRELPRPQRGAGDRPVREPREARFAQTGLLLAERAGLSSDWNRCRSAGPTSASCRPGPRACSSARRWTAGQGVQPERLPPYCSTLNPGWDSSLPLYRPLPMFQAMKAAARPGWAATVSVGPPP
ncbi:MAG: hypothetical protein U0736_07535 [Gemmataceae bacterium]